ESPLRRTLEGSFHRTGMLLGLPLDRDRARRRRIAAQRHISQVPLKRDRTKPQSSRPVDNQHGSIGTGRDANVLAGSGLDRLGKLIAIQERRRHPLPGELQFGLAARFEVVGAGQERPLSRFAAEPDANRAAIVGRSLLLAPTYAK